MQTNLSYSAKHKLLTKLLTPQRNEFFLLRAILFSCHSPEPVILWSQERGDCMNIFIAIDSFKGSLSSLQAGNAAADGIRRVFPAARIHIAPVADGGEGTVNALVSALSGQMQSVSVCDPLGREIVCQYGIIPPQTAVMEMSAAAGLTLLTPDERDPLRTTTYGVGQMLRDAIAKGCRKFIIGIGGSATNDGGAGMLQALGFELLDSSGHPIPFGAAGLAQLTQIRCSRALPELKDCTFHVACDVNNPLCGENGCSAIYAPQKGADSTAVQQMDRWLAHYAAQVKAVFPAADPNFPGAGAAGGLGFAFLSFLNGTLVRGIDLVLQQLNSAQHIAEADIVITGEGRLDAQTVMGKAPAGIAALAKQYGKPVIAFSGIAAKGAAACNDHGIDAFFPILRQVYTLDEAMDTQTAANNLTDTAEQVFRLLRLSFPGHA